eukprot:scaffold312909_cov21-Tisochrysis_lutea.AAC.1
MDQCRAGVPKACPDNLEIHHIHGLKGGPGLKGCHRTDIPKACLTVQKCITDMSPGYPGSDERISQGRRVQGLPALTLWKSITDMT